MEDWENPSEHEEVARRFHQLARQAANRELQRLYVDVAYWHERIAARLLRAMPAAQSSLASAYEA